MDIEVFRENLLIDVSVCAAADKNFKHSAFVDVAVSLLADAGEVSDFEPCYYRGKCGTHNVGIDGYSFDAADSSVRVFIADPILTDEGETLGQQQARSLFSRLRYFIEDGLSGRLTECLDDNSPARELVDLLRLRTPEIARIRAYLLTDATLSSTIRDWPAGTVGETPIEFHIWDITRFYRAQTSASGQDEVIIDFGSRTDGKGIPCIEASVDGAEYTGYLCVIPGRVLADIYDEYGSRLLEGNVRAFLSAKVKVNRGIRETVLTEPQMFFAYNNGIAATASSAHILPSANGNTLVSATDLQIVNGGQTTASLSTVRRNDKAKLDDVFVPMKLSVIPPEKATDVIPHISQYANSQNKVSEADFFSNHEFHRRLQEISRRLWAPARAGMQHETHWFYERARGQYINEMAALTKARRNRFMEANPKDQLITKTDLAKSENSWNQFPQLVSRGAQTNFVKFANSITDQWNTDKDNFHEEYFKAAVARLLIFRRTEALVSKQSWYAGGYRANVVTYTIARIALEVAKFPDQCINFNAVWRAQEISDALRAQIEHTAEIVYRSITTPQRGVENVTQWCKRDECWEAVKRERAELLPAFQQELTSKQEVRQQHRDAKAVQKIDSGVEAQMAVIALGGDYWRSLASWALARQAVSPEDKRLLSAAQKNGYVPTDRQSARLLQLRDRLEDEGFIHVP